MLYPGKMVLYTWRPGQVRAGQTESAAMILRVNRDGTVNLRVFADGTPDALDLRNVPAMSETIQTHCWSRNPDDSDRAQPEPQPEPIRRGPGRPSNAELAARRQAEAAN